MNIKMCNGNNLSHELLLTTRQKTKLGNAFKTNVSTDMKWSKAQTSKIIQSGGFLGSLLSKIAGPSMDVVVTLVKIFLHRSRNPKEYTWFWDNKFNNFK